jgi:hypothetical protein
MIQLAYAVDDADGVILPQYMVTEIRCRAPIKMADMSSELAAQLGTMADVAFSDEGQNTLVSGEPIVSL